MKQKYLLRAIAAGILAVMLLPASALASDSAGVVSAALEEVGYTEEAKEHTKFGEWYGYPNSYWCDMFVSWCAMKGDVPKEQFPRHCSCTEHVKLFTKLGRYRNSAARGGEYIPQQGDVIFFYDDLNHSDGKVSNHTGLVLYVENGYVYTIEGNALTNRLDYASSEVSALLDDALDPPDRVVVNYYPLDAPHIHGYGIPAYDAQTPLALEGFVDLGKYRESADVYQYLCDAGVMAPTSAHTFSPEHGMT
ncbi:MAG: CHAP domain-containing protein, partial [Oscillospiraceae bacterium]|nr:CHAP domain-containing protein [Oscillospiraceae bacterium]